MTDQDELRDRIMEPIWQNTMLTTEGAKQVAQTIIDEFGLTMRGDGCGYHEIYGSYDTRFGKWEQQ